MSNLYLLFSHELTIEQRDDIKNNLDIKKIYYLPQELQMLWSNIPADLFQIKDYLSPIIDWLKENIHERDYILIQGDFGASFYLVQWVFVNNCFPIYATSERIIIKETNNDGKINIERKFIHKRFRKYEKYSGFC